MMREVVLLHFAHVSGERGVVKTGDAVNKKRVVSRRESAKLTHNACSRTERLENTFE